MDDVSTHDGVAPGVYRPGGSAPAGGANSALRAAIDATTDARLDDPRGFDAIVVGAGASGGLAAQQLTQAGLTVLLLDAGWDGDFFESPLRKLIAKTVPLVADPRLEDILPPRVVNAGRRALRLAGKLHQPVQSRCYAWPLAPGSFVDDRQNPYVAAPDQPFSWIRAHQIGGRMTIPGHGRQYYRLGPADFMPDDGLSPAWGLAPGELDPWYALVEDHLRLAGGTEGCPALPDSRIRQPLAPSAAEAQVFERVRARWRDAHPVLGRFAAPMNTVEAAALTKRLYCRTGALVRDVAVDDSGHAAGVNWFDRASRRIRGARAPIVFLCASTLSTTRILLSSRTARHPEGIGAASGVLGRYLMDHIYVQGTGIGGALPGEPVANEAGRCVFLPRFDRCSGTGAGGRGFGIQVFRWSAERGRSHFVAGAFGEMTPRAHNRVLLDKTFLDAWGLPVLRIECRRDESDRLLAAQQREAIRAVAQALDVTLDPIDETAAPPGTAAHECGTARMGASPADSVCDPNNEVWDARGLYVTDAAAFASQGFQNPTLTILALTARACHRAAQLTRRQATAAA
jgi:choline dehydrogenase-like flavoprotein